LTDDLPPCPIPLQVNFEVVPTDLRSHNQWVLWKYEWKKGKDTKPGKWDKPPYTIQGRHASATDSRTWFSFDDVKTAYLQGQKLPHEDEEYFDGIGFVPTKGAQSEAQLTLIDLDKCRNSTTGEIEAWAKEELDLINSYSEISPSGTGIRIVTKGVMLPDNGKGRKKGHLEIYQTAHYLTITGQRLNDYPAAVELRVEEVDCFYKKHFCKTHGKEKKPEKQPGKRTKLTDDEIIALATNAANGAKFKRLLNGDTTGYKSDSEADEALCCIIAFYTTDEDQIERIWRQSGLSKREKFERDDYRQRTIENALQTVKEHYMGNSTKAGQRKGKHNGGISVASTLVKLAKESGCELWRDPEREPYVSFYLDGHRENHLLQSKAITRWLGKLLFDSEGKAANKTAMQDAINLLEAEAVFNGPEYSVFVRVGEYRDAIYIDLCDDRWRSVEITSSGWNIVDTPPIRFKRSKGMLPLPEPTRGGTLDDLKPLLNISDEKTWILIKAILVGSLNPKGPYPVAIFGGEQGSAKSTTQKLIRNLIDPNEASLRRPPKKEQDLMIAAINSWIMSFDNLSGIPNDLSDSLCHLSTGGALSTRELYTNTEETILSARRPIFLNGIESIPNRHDLLDRAILINLPPLKEAQRRTEKEIMDEFNRIYSSVLGALYNAVSLGLKNLPTTQLERKPRMADFAVWVTACEEGLECKPGFFLKAYRDTLNDANLDALSSDVLAQTIINIAEHEISPWSGTATELLSKINSMNGYNYQRPPGGWPQTASYLSNKLNRITPALRKVGVEIDSKKTAKAKIITIKERNDGMTACDDKSERRRHYGNQVQETLDMANKGHNDGDDGDLSSFICGEKEGEERGREEDTSECDTKRESIRKRPSSPSSPSLDSESGCHMTVTQPSSFLALNDGMPTIGLHPRKDLPTPGRKSDKQKEAATCPICGVDIGPGYSSRTFEGINYCTSCPNHLSLLRESVRELIEKNGNALSEAGIYDDLISRGGRPPKKEFIPSMLRVLGFEERDGKWFLSSAKDVEAPAERADA